MRNRLDAYDYTLPSHLIATRPITPRDASKLLVVNRKDGSFQDLIFRDLIDFMEPDQLLLFNDTRVIPARLCGRRRTGGKVEVFLVRDLGAQVWEVLMRPAKKLRVGERVVIGSDFSCEVLSPLERGEGKVQFSCQGDFDALLSVYGEVPLPPYMKRSEENFDRERYQTVYAKTQGAVAAPTAGLHFTSGLLEKLKRKGVLQAFLTLHVGLGTFYPVTSETITEHKMHSEYYEISEETAEKVNRSKRHIAVGTTTCRALEAASMQTGVVRPTRGETDIFIYPGYSFRVVQSLLTNFHLPKSSLLMLVSAFAGCELIREAYKKAVRDGYRFYSYGDAMLIL